MLQEGYGIMPNRILFSNDLSDKEKLLYCLISSLCAEKGYCRANNNYLGDKLGITAPRISGWISSLSKGGYINIKSESSGQNRTITLAENSTPPCGKQHTPLAENGKGTLAENSKHNNTISNIIKEDYNIIPHEIKNFIETQSKNMSTIAYQVNKQGYNYYQSSVIEYDKLKKEVLEIGDPETLAPAILEYVMNDDFRKNNIGSIKKLREKNRDGIKYWVVMLEKMKQNQDNKKRFIF